MLISAEPMCVSCLALLVAACATFSPHVAKSSPSDASIPIEVRKPEGAGPFPAIVLLHDCSGLGPRSSGRPHQWAQLLVREGYVVLLPDSFSTRGYPNGICTDPSPSRADVAPRRRVRDAYEALAYARSLPYVDGAHVGIMGGSHGGSTTLAAIASARAPDAGGFAAAVALYPGCAPPVHLQAARRSGVYRPSAPLLILIGEKDDWTPAEACRRMVDASRASGYDIDLEIYPGAQHSFDSGAPIRYRADRINANAPGGRGATTGGNIDAWADSIREVREFFARRLRRSRRSDQDDPVR